MAEQENEQTQDMEGEDTNVIKIMNNSSDDVYSFEGKEKEVETWYDIKDKPGLFVCIYNTKFGRNVEDLLTDSNELEEIWKSVVPKQYHGSLDFIVGRNLLPNPKVEEAHGNKKYEKDEQYYEGFIQKVENRIKDLKPAFISVYIFSHGGEDGTFLLSAKESYLDCPCPLEKHNYLTLFEYKTLSKDQIQKRSINAPSCYRRSFDVLVARIQDLEKDEEKVLGGKPKIFIADFCRYGKNTDGIPNESHGGQSHKVKHKYRDDLVTVHSAPGADTIILYSTLENKPTYTLQLPMIMKEMVSKLKSLSNDKMKKLKAAVGTARVVHELPELRVEDWVRGWLPNVFEDVRHKLGLLTDISRKHNSTKRKECNYDKQVPEVQTTLTRRLSALELLRDVMMPSSETQSQSLPASNSGCENLVPQNEASCTITDTPTPRQPTSESSEDDEFVSAEGTIASESSEDDEFVSVKSTIASDQEHTEDVFQDAENSGLNKDTDGATEVEKDISSATIEHPQDD